MPTERLRVLDSRTLAADWGVLKKTTFEIRRRDGTWQSQSREIYDRGNGAVILLYALETKTVILTRQFRLPAFVNGHAGWLIEAPAGLLDEASPEVRIRAEMEEETGYCVAEIEPVFEVFMSPGSVTERLHFFIGRYRQDDRVAEGGGAAEEGEDIEVLEMPFDAAMAMVASGVICDAKTIMLLQHLALTRFA